MNYSDATLAYKMEQAPDLMMRHAAEYLIDDLRVLISSYNHGNDFAKPEIDNVTEAINVIDRLRGTTEVSA
jgi:hypothetical protein